MYENRRYGIPEKDLRGDRHDGQPTYRDNRVSHFTAKLKLELTSAQHDSGFGDGRRGPPGLPPGGLALRPAPGASYPDTPIIGIPGQPPHKPASRLQTDYRELDDLDVPSNFQPSYPAVTRNARPGPPRDPSKNNGGKDNPKPKQGRPDDGGKAGRHGQEDPPKDPRHRGHKPDEGTDHTLARRRTERNIYFQ